MQVFQFLAGGLILLFGRPLYWAFVAVLGFLIGFEYMKELAITQSPLIRMLAALGVGLLAAGLAVGFQWLAFGLVGFLAGYYLVQSALARFEVVTDHEMIFMVVGGAVAGVLALWLVDWAVIFLSSLAGASMMANQIDIEPRIRLAIFVGLAAVGVLFQQTRLRRQQRPR